MGVQNVTLVEPLESRSQLDVTKVATHIFCRFKAMGLQMLRVHTDRERAFLSRAFQSFCRRFGLYQTMTGGAGLGPLTAPFRTMTIMGTSPFMSQGYVLMDGDQVQHARVVVQQDPIAERAVPELQMIPDPEKPPHRLTGKQPMEPMLAQLPPPRPLLDPGLCRLHATSGGDQPVWQTYRTGLQRMWPTISSSIVH